MDDVPGSSVIQVLRTQSLTLAAQQEIERMVLSGELCAGDRVNENLIAAKLGISRGPVREACRALTASGLLEAHVNRGVFVRRLQLEDASEIYDIRASLEGLACRLLATRIQPPLLAEIERLADGMAEAAEAGDRSGYAPLNLQFHDLVFAACGNRRLAALYRGLVNELSLYRHTSQSRPGALEAGVAEHRAILAAFARRDPAAAERAMQSHVLRAKVRLLAVASAETPGAELAHKAIEGRRATRGRAAEP